LVDIFSIDTNDVNEILRSYNEMASNAGRHVRCNLKPINGVLPFDKSFEDEQFIIAGIIDNFILNVKKIGLKEVDISASMKNGKIKVKISDNGPGISKDFLTNRLFVQGATTKEKGKGGQGLYLTLEYLRLLKKLGKDAGIEVESKVEGDDAWRLIFEGENLDERKVVPSDRKDKGTAFTITLPAVKINASNHKKIEHLAPQTEL
jgi:signal transduction histidine kinase